MRNDDDEGSNAFLNWVIGIGLAGFVVGGWFALGQPGRSLQDGDYGCQSRALNPLLGAGPGATVRNGQVVDVWDFDMRTGSQVSLPWEDAEQQSRTEFTVSAAFPESGLPFETYTCAAG